MDTENSYTDMSHKVRQEICQIAKDLSSKNSTMTMETLGLMIEAKYCGYSHPYQMRGLVQAAYRYAENLADKDDVREAILTVFVNNDGSPIWKER